MKIIAFYKPLDLYIVKLSEGLYSVTSAYNNSPMSVLYSGDISDCTTYFANVITGLA